MGVVNLASGKPTLHLSGGAAAQLARLTPPGHKAVIHLTLTDEFPLAQAQVIIEAVEIPGFTTETPSLETKEPDHVPGLSGRIMPAVMDGDRLDCSQNFRYPFEKAKIRD